MFSSLFVFFPKINKWSAEVIHSSSQPMFLFRVTRQPEPFPATCQRSSGKPWTGCQSVAGPAEGSHSKTACYVIKIQFQNYNTGTLMKIMWDNLRSKYIKAKINPLVLVFSSKVHFLEICQTSIPLLSQLRDFIQFISCRHLRVGRFMDNLLQYKKVTFPQKCFPMP